MASVSRYSEHWLHKTDGDTVTAERRGRTPISISGTAPPVDILNSLDTSGYTVQSPISNANMWDYVGANVGNNTSTFNRVSVVDVGGAEGKVLDHFNLAGSFIDSSPKYGMAMFAPLATPVDEATLSYRMRVLTPSGTVGTNNPWGKGGKLPGLCGVVPGQNGGVPPSGGSPTIYGWSGRCMWLVPGVGAARSPVEFLGYFYHPNQSAGSFGINKLTGVGWLGTGGVALDQWVDVEVYHKMNTVITEGATNPPADGIYSIFWTPKGGTRVRVFHDTAVVYRRYAAGRITHYAHDNFYGGGTVDWAPTGDTHWQFCRLRVTTPA